MKVKFIDLDRQLHPIRETVDAAMQRVIDRGQFVLGPEVREFEDRFAEFVGVEHAIGVSSGTDAILAALMAIGIGPGDEVITSAFTFVAPAQAIARLGATPVFVDIDPDSYAIDPDAVREAIGPDTAAILPVHLFGQMADMTALRTIADEYDLPLVEDAAQAIGSRHAGRHAGTFGDVGCFSFFPTKTLGAFGDGGMIVTDDHQIAREIRRIRHHGSEPKNVHHRLGGNFRLDALQAAILDVKLDHVDNWIAGRRANAAAYDQALPARVQPSIGRDNEHAWHQYVIRIDERDGFREQMWHDGVETQVYYPTPCDCQPCFAEYEPRISGELTETYAACREVLALPVFPELTEDELDYVVGRLRAHLAARAA